MTTKPLAKNDPRTVDELVNAALSETDEDVTWELVYALHWRGTEEVLQRATELCESRCSRERRLGADILGQLGVPDRTFPAECSKLLRVMLRRDEEPGVLRAALVGLSHQEDTKGIPLIAGFSSHPDAEVRHGVALALTQAVVLAPSGPDAPLAIESLISLSNDPVADVRDWTTFGLGTQIELDTPAIRDALADRLYDPDDDTRGEAFVGLACRKDGRVIEALKMELSSDCIGTLAIAAAELIASKELHSQLVSLRDWWDVNPPLLERAIAASEPQQGIE